MQKVEYKDIEYDEVEISGIFDFEIIKSDIFSVVDKKFIFFPVSIRKTGKKLEVNHPFYLWPFIVLIFSIIYLRRPVVKITMPQLHELKLAGFSRGSISGFNTRQDFKLNVSGNSKVTGELIANKAQFILSGNSYVKFTGSVGNLVIRTSNSSKVDLSKFTVTSSKEIQPNRHNS
ncbi:MAG: DUF2807 domain-containing protein [Chloroflexi bacterium]|nr:DUF2807 domain-containing protein [Chloroflexota bacterium]